MKKSQNSQAQKNLKDGRNSRFACQTAAVHFPLAYIQNWVKLCLVELFLEKGRLFTVLLIFIQRLLRTRALEDLLITLKQQLVLLFTFSQISHVLTFIFASEAKFCPVTNPNIVIKDQAPASIKIILMHWQRSKSCQKSKCSPTIKACVKW